VSTRLSLPIAWESEGRLREPEPLPRLYSRWLSQALGRLPPREARADCATCPMTSDDPTRHPAAAVHFVPTAKCCTYLPELPSFLVGMALLDKGLAAVGAQSIVDRIDRVIGVTPLGLIRTPVYGLIYDAVKSAGFGRVDAMCCPHYSPEQGGKCGIWEYRNSVCSTFFCKHREGSAGAAMWEAIRAYLHQLERELSVWAALELGIPPLGITKAGSERTGNLREHVLSELQSTGISDWRGHELWGPWNGRSKEYFMECGSLLKDKSWEEVTSLCGPEVQLRLNGLQDALNGIDRALPTRARVDECRVFPGPENAVWIGTYSPYDWVLVDADLWQTLSSQAGVITLLDIMEVTAARGQDLQRCRTQLQSLVNWGVLKEEPCASQAARNAEVRGSEQTRDGAEALAAI
jgi:hypothetical protein